MKYIILFTYSLSFLLSFLINNSYAGGKDSQFSDIMTTSNYYGSYSLSAGQLDWSKNRTSADNEPMLYQSISIDSWLGKKLTQDTEGVLSAKFTYYGRSGNIGEPEDDAIRQALNLNLLHLRHYDNSTSYINLGYIYSEENETGSSNVDANSFIVSTGLATESIVLEFGIGSSNTETRSYYVDEIIYYNLTYKLPISSKINLIATKHYTEYERKIASISDSDGDEMDISGLKVTYDLKNSFITLGGERYTIKNGPAPEHTGGSIYFSWTLPFGKSPNSRTNFILDNRPAVDRVIGFGAAFN